MDLKELDEIYNSLKSLEIEITVELYSDKKNVQLERQIENLFSDREIQKAADTYLDDEEMFLTAYSFTIYQYI